MNLSKSEMNLSKSEMNLSKGSKSPERSEYSRRSVSNKGKDFRDGSTMSDYEKHSSPISAGKPTLAQAIFDEFLVCKICLEGYKNPKSLECLHTFCEQCIDSHVTSESSYKKYSDYREFTCPLCRKRTQLPLGGCRKLPDNFLVSNLSEMIGRQRPSKFPFCDFCKLVDNKFRDAHAKCLDCAKMLCPSCVNDHQEIRVTSSHSIFDVDIEKDISCKEHPDETVRYYCEPCETCVCVVCTFKEHRQHKVSQFAEAVTVYREGLQTLVSQCKAKISGLDSRIASVTKCDSIIRDVREKIKSTAACLMDEIHQRESILLDELDNIYGQECLEHLDKKADIIHEVENFRSTCKLAETILHGKDIELLLLYNDVQEKLNAMNQLDAVTILPKTVDKVVEFKTGSFDFGYLYDYDRPLLSTMTLKRNSNTMKSPRQLHPSVAAVKLSSITQESSTSDDDVDDSDDEVSTSGSSSIVTSVRKHGVMERGTMTECKKFEDKAVNTKARSMLKNNNKTETGGVEKRGRRARSGVDAP